MAILKVARMGHPILRRVADPIDPAQIGGPEIQRLIRDMAETMVEYRGVGLAAPQVHESRQLVLCGGEEDEEGRSLLRVLINPEIKPLTDEVLGMYEGCLSVPGLRGYVERPAAISIKAYDGRGERVELALEGFPAVVVQHECDHLQGRLFVDRLQDTRKLAFEEEARRFMDLGEDEDEEEDDPDGDHDQRIQD